MLNLISRRWKLAALLAMLFCLNLVTLRNTHQPLEDWQAAVPSDWKVYQSAALVVAEGQSYHLYDGADTGADPQLKLSPRDSALTKAYNRLGFGQRMAMYVYPPLLADLMVPLLAVPVQYAGYVWDAINVTFAALCLIVAIELSETPYKPLTFLFVFLSLPEMRVVTDAIHAGQISILLTLLWMLGVCCYKKRWMYASALALAVATSLKLTPLLAIIPFVLWKEWRWLRWFAMNMVLLFLAVVVINGPHSMLVCFTRVMPAMSRGVGLPWNRTWISYVQMLYLVSHHAVTGWDIHQPVAPGPMALAVGKAVSAAVLVLFVVALYRRQNEMNVQARVEALVATALLSLVIAPVSWVHAYVVLVPALILMWVRAFREPQPGWGLVLLCLATLILTGSFLDHVSGHLHSLEGQTLLMGLHPMLSSALCFYMVLQPHKAIERHSESGVPTR